MSGAEYAPYIEWVCSLSGDGRVSGAVVGSLMMMMMTFITRMGEGQWRTKKGRKATKSEGSGLEEGASRALIIKLNQQITGINKHPVQ